MVDWHENATYGEIYPEDHILSDSGWTVAQDIKDAPLLWVFQYECGKAYKYIGTEEEASQYEVNIPSIGVIYSSEAIIGHDNVGSWVNEPTIKHEWEEVKEFDSRILDDNTPAEAWWCEPESSPQQQGLRYNKNKPKYSLIDLNCMEDCARVLEFGMNKYSRNNWKKGLVRSEIIDSLLRHIAALQSGEEVDPESGLSHIGHIQCNALFLGNKNNINDEL